LPKLLATGGIGWLSTRLRPPASSGVAVLHQHTTRAGAACPSRHEQPSMDDVAGRRGLCANHPSAAVDA